MPLAKIPDRYATGVEFGVLGFGILGVCRFWGLEFRDGFGVFRVLGFGV